MKKHASRSRKPPRRKRRASPRDTLFKDVDLGLLRRLLADELPLEDEGLEGMVAEVLNAEPEELDDMPDAETLTELDEILNQTRLDAAGGDARARETMGNVRAMIDEAASRDAINPAMLIMLGRLFAGAEIEIGAAARAAMGRIVDSGIFHDPGEDAYRAFVQPALSAFTGGPFELHEEISALIEIFPLRYKVTFLERLAAEPAALARQTALGFLLHREEPLAEAAIRGLAAAAARGRLDPKSRRWIGVIRPWLTPPRRGALDAAIPSLDHAAPRVVTDVVKATASVCDGSGASVVSTMIRNESGFALASVMIKPTGVADSMLLEDLTKSEAEALERRASSSMPTSEISRATAARLIRLALGRNLASGAPPPFSFVRAVEAIGHDALVPDPATLTEVIAAALSEAPDRDSAEAIREAHESVADSEFADNWFEAGEEVDAILGTADSIEAGAQALLEGYLPRRRGFWATQCARSALALKDGAAARDATWKQLALVGRDILRDVPLDDIPLMGLIAEQSAVAFFMQR